jgi:hypothetical protein
MGYLLFVSAHPVGGESPYSGTFGRKSELSGTQKHYPLNGYCYLGILI